MLPLTILMLSTAVSVFCKESGVVVLGVIMLYDFCIACAANSPTGSPTSSQISRSSRSRATWPGRAHFDDVLCAQPDFWATAPAGAAVGGQPAGQAGRGFSDRPHDRHQSDRQIFLAAPVAATLSCDYSYNQIPIVDWHFARWEDWEAILALAAIVIVLLVAIRNYHRNKPLFFFVFFFFGTLLPSSNLIPESDVWPIALGQALVVHRQHHGRAVFVPAIDRIRRLAVIAVYSICRRLIPNLDVSPWAQRIWLQVVARTALSLVVVAYGVRGFNRNDDWKDDETLWTKAVETCPNSFKTHKSLAFALYERDPEGKNIDRIIEEGEKARQVTDKTQIVMLHLGATIASRAIRTPNIRLTEGRSCPRRQSLPWYQKSVEALSQAVPLDKEFNDDNRRKELRRGRNPNEIPDIGNHEIYWNLGISYMRLSDYQKALDAYVYMRHLAPTNPDSYLSIASVYLATGHAEEAGVSLLQTLLLDGSRTQALRLLTDIYRQIDKEGCAVVMNQGEPRLNQDCAVVHNHICSAYYGLIQVFLETNDRDLHQKAIDAEQNAVRNYHCSPDAFKKLLPDRPSTVSLTP